MNLGPKLWLLTLADSAKKQENEWKWEFWWIFMNETEFLDIQNVNLQIKSECGNRKQTRNGDWRQYIEPTIECLRIHSSKRVKDTQNI